MSVTARRHLSALIAAMHRGQQVDTHDRSHPLVQTVCCDRWACLKCDGTIRKDPDGRHVHTARLPYIEWSPYCTEPAA